jgi:hypothetical protein
MKSADVAGKAGPPQVCHTPAEAARQVEAGGRASTVAGAKAAVAAAIQRGGPRTVDRLAGEVAQTLRSYLQAQPARAFVVEIAAGHALSVAGYAPRAAAASSAAASSAAAGTAASSASSKGEWAFLDDSRLSIEDKLFRFMKLVLKKSDDELVDKMKAFKAGKASGTAGGTQAKKSSGGLFGLLKKAFPPLAALAKAIPALPGLVDKLATQLGPQLLGALMVPLGAPWAAPLVQRAASELLPAALAAIDGGSGGSASSGSSGSSGVSKEGDERLQLLEIERLMQKTNQMFATVSNVLKATHDAAMTAVNNIR